MAKWNFTLLLFCSLWTLVYSTSWAVGPTNFTDGTLCWFKSDSNVLTSVVLTSVATSSVPSVTLILADGYYNSLVLKLTMTNISYVNYTLQPVNPNAVTFSNCTFSITSSQVVTISNLFFNSSYIEGVNSLYMNNCTFTYSYTASPKNYLIGVRDNHIMLSKLTCAVAITANRLH